MAPVVGKVAGVIGQAFISAIAMAIVLKVVKKLEKPVRDGTTQKDDLGRYIRSDPEILKVLRSIDAHMRFQSRATGNAEAFFPDLEKLLKKANLSMAPDKAPTLAESLAEVIGGAEAELIAEAVSGAADEIAAKDEQSH